MVKTYKTWEVIKMLTENPKLEFQSKDKFYKLLVNSMGNLNAIYKNGETEGNIPLYDCELDIGLTHIFESVYLLRSNNGWIVDTDAILNGKWYIEETE